MTTNALLCHLLGQDIVKFFSEETNLSTLQDKIYNFFLEIVKKYPPETGLKEFKCLFIDCLRAFHLNDCPVIQKFLLLSDEQEFHHTLKRCCYILINNWASRRKHQYIQELISLFEKLPECRVRNSYHKINLYKQWLENFVHSQNYQELKIFNCQKRDNDQKGHWSDRYASYLLVAQSLDTDKPQEQQEAAIKLYKQMKEKYKFDLAMYIARSQSAASSDSRYHNPSILGDEVLRLIKKIVIKKGKFSYENLAHIFLKQTETQTLRDFKTSLQKYLFFSVGNQAIALVLQQSINDKLLLWKPEIDKTIINNSLSLRLCNKLIDFLTTENRYEPSELFNLLVSQGHPLTLVIILLKITFISKNSRSHLEARIADLISYYQYQSEKECQWFIQFLEFFNITFAIYAENVEYNLLKVPEANSVDTSKSNLHTYHVFSQVKEE